MIILLSAGAWYFFGMGSRDTSTNNSLVSSGKTSTSDLTAEGTAILNTLNRVNGIKLNTSFLASPAYKSLVESKTDIGVLSVGRDNPFAPVSFDGKVIPVKSIPAKVR